MLPYIFLLWALYLLTPAGAGMNEDMKFAEQVFHKVHEVREQEWPKDFVRNAKRVVCGTILNATGLLFLFYWFPVAWFFVPILLGFFLTLAELLAVSALASRR
jgi:hypothetical protein